MSSSEKKSPASTKTTAKQTAVEQTASKQTANKKSAAGSDPKSRSVGLIAAFSVAVVALIVAVCAVGFYGYRAYDVYFNEKPAQSARENAVDAAETAILNVLTIDPKDPGAWQRRIDASLTGEARKQVTSQIIESLRTQLQQAGDNAASLTARITRSAATEIDVEDQSGAVIIYAEATAKRKNEAGQIVPFGFLVTVGKQDGDHWRATNITPLDSMAVTEQPTGDTQQPATTTTPGGN